MFYIAILLVSIYLLISIIRYKCIPQSISDTFYLGNSWIFSATMIVIGFLLSVSLLNVTPEIYQFVAFFCGAGLLFVGAAPHFKEELQANVHFGGAYVFAITSLIWTLLYSSPWILLTWLCAILWFKTKLRTFWAEITCVINLIIAYLLG